MKVCGGPRTACLLSFLLPDGQILFILSNFRNYWKTRTLLHNKNKSSLSVDVWLEYLNLQCCNPEFMIMECIHYLFKKS